MHKKEGGVLYKFMQFDEIIFEGGYYINTKIQTIYEINPINHLQNQKDLTKIT